MFFLFNPLFCTFSVIYFSILGSADDEICPHFHAAQLKRWKGWFGLILQLDAGLRPRCKSFLCVSA